MSSRLVSVSYNTSIEKALELMLEKGIRNLNVRNENKDDIGIMNDRKILEFLLSYEGRRVMARPMGLDAVGLDLSTLRLQRCQTKYSNLHATQFLSDVSTPCLLLQNNRVVTPWDVVMKGLRK